MAKLIIRGVATHPGNWLSRRRALGCLRRTDETSWVCRVSFGSCPEGTTIKLTGLAYFAPLRWRRVRFGGLHEALSMTHEDSDRVVAARTPSGSVSLRSYVYRGGRGPATTGGVMEAGAPPQQQLAVVEDGEAFRMVVRPANSGTLFSVDARSDSGEAFHSRERALPSWCFVTAPHAIGWRQPAAPARIEAQVKLV